MGKEAHIQLSEKSYQVEKIIGIKIQEGISVLMKDGQVFYKIKWKGYDQKYNTWEPQKTISHITPFLNKYHKDNANKLIELGEQSKKQQRKKTKLIKKYKHTKNNYSQTQYQDPTIHSPSNQLGQRQQKQKSKKRIHSDLVDDSFQDDIKFFQLSQDEMFKQVKCIVEINKQFQIKVQYQSGEQGFISKQQAHCNYSQQYISFLEQYFLEHNS